MKLGAAYPAEEVREIRRRGELAEGYRAVLPL